MQTILVIDDDDSLRDTIGVMLEQEGYRAELVADGRSGYSRALSLKPDLLLVIRPQGKHSCAITIPDRFIGVDDVDRGH